MSSKGKPYYDVVLVQPSITWAYYPFEHLGLAYLTAALRREGFTVKIVDALLLRWSMADLYRELDQYRIGILGVTLISHGYPTTVEFLRFYRERHPETRIIAGGHFATFAADKILAHTEVFDAIVLGEGEYSAVNYCRRILRGVEVELTDVAMPGRTVRRSHDRIRDMDQLAPPARDCLELAISQGAIPSVTASRGCYARCAFCTVHNFYAATSAPRWVARSVDNVIAELYELHRQYRIKHFMFVDDNFMGPGQMGRRRALEFAAAYRKSQLPMTFDIDCRAMDVCEEVIEALRDVGLRSVFLGIESVSDRDLVAYRKGQKAETCWKAVRILKKFRISYTIAMIMFNPETDEQSLLKNIEFLDWAGYYPRNPVSILNLYEGTELRDRYPDLIYGPFWDYRFHFARESVKIIYEEAMKFCKKTLPFERDLPRRRDGEPTRRELHRMRLFFLKDLTLNQGQGRESPAEIRKRWDDRVDRLQRKE